MNLQNLTLKQFLEKTANNEPVPGGGSISALHGAVAAALTEMLANITIGKKNYSAVEETMKLNATKASALRTEFLTDIDRDAEAYNLVFQAFRLPKDTDEQKVLRSEKIQEATKVAALVPMEVAERAFELLDLISETTRKGNKNAITDGCVAMMTCRTAVLGALLNVRINLASIKDERFVKELSEKCSHIEKETLRKEQELMEFVGEEVRSGK
ncbi:MAG: Methenyltetrahydrofolate cyclohydrolase [Bacteroidetes bacterium ADurb.BinA261]|jgi:formiminotetrahydrofolate cyclodeaminase|nr:MAG: Methenyltetrahydrofolate cyclohydrolase [Bacteroidetes bacterium ADurb.BinA261]